VFDVLGSMLAPGGLHGCTVADLFAGSGALGIEALSRGAGESIFVDQHRGAVETVRANLAALNFGYEQATVVQSEVLGWLSGAGARPFDLALCDPPYAFDQWEELWERLDARVVVAESGREVSVPPPWTTVKRKRYGRTVVVVAVKSCPVATPELEVRSALGASDTLPIGTAHDMVTSGDG